MTTIHRMLKLAACTVVVFAVSGCGGDKKLSHFDQGVVYFDEGKFEEAATEFSLSLEGGKAKKSSQYNLALSYHNAGRLELAKAEYEELVTQYPEDAAIHVNYADLLRQMGDTVVAEQHYDRAIQLEPVRAFTHCAKGIYYLDKQTSEGNQQALIVLAEAVRVDVRESNAHYLYAVALERAGDAAKAREHYQQAVELDGRNVQAHVALARHMVEEGDYAGALRLYIRAGAVDPSSAAAFHGAGICYRETGEQERSLQALWKARSLNPQSKETDAQVLKSAAALLAAEIQYYAEKTGGKKLSQQETQSIQDAIEQLLKRFNPQQE